MDINYITACNNWRQCRLLQTCKDGLYKIDKSLVRAWKLWFNAYALSVVCNTIMGLENKFLWKPAWRIVCRIIVVKMCLA